MLKISRYQRGAYLITFALFLLFLLGFMGIALDFGRLFVVRSELQTAADSCALAAARELNLQPGAVTRATSAGNAVGSSNSVQFQSGKANQISIGFSETLVPPGGYNPTLSDSKAKYAECSYALTGLKPWLLQAMAAFSGNSAYANNLSVAARAVATRAPSQTACPIPVVLPQGSYTTGQWITFVPNSGPMTWGNLNGTTNANTTNSQMRDGYCISPPPNQPVFTPGAQATVAEYWNFRFGIYKNNPSSPTGAPDYSSFIYNTSNWQGRDSKGNIGNAYQGSSPNGTPNFLAQRLAFKPCGANPSACGLGSGGYKTVAQTPTLKTTGADRRIVTVPIVAGGIFQNKLACMLMLDPISPGSLTAHFEYLGLVTDFNSPCTTSGIAGGTIGPLIPVLVR